jgi:hypothetical protein
VVVLDVRGSADLFRRVAPTGDDRLAEAARLAGAYRCDDAEATATIGLDGDEVRLRLRGPYGRDDYGLERFAPLKWTSQMDEIGIGGVLEFTADPEGRVMGFAMTTGRTHRLPFARAG